MDFVVDLWLPILLSAVGVFIVSSVIHMCTPMHKHDYVPIPDEDATLEGLRNAGLSPGLYVFPHAKDMKELATPEFKARCERGPVGYLTLLPRELWNMNRSLVQWFLYAVLVAVLTAYVARFSLPDGTAFGTVFRLTGTVATMGFALGAPLDSIWKGVPWSVSGRFVLDGFLYGLTTGVLFAFFWP